MLKNLNITRGSCQPKTNLFFTSIMFISSTECITLERGGIRPFTKWFCLCSGVGRKARFFVLSPHRTSIMWFRLRLPKLHCVGLGKEAIHTVCAPDIYFNTMQFSKSSSFRIIWPPPRWTTGICFKFSFPFK